MSMISGPAEQLAEAKINTPLKKNALERLK